MIQWNGITDLPQIFTYYRERFPHLNFPDFYVPVLANKPPALIWSFRSEALFGGASSAGMLERFRHAYPTLSSSLFFFVGRLDSPQTFIPLSMEEVAKSPDTDVRYVCVFYVEVDPAASFPTELITGFEALASTPEELAFVDGLRTLARTWQRLLST